MKIQCSCGAKYAFDITPEMAASAVKFVCPACGLDTSDHVNHLVRQELARSAAAAAAPASQPAPVAIPVPPPVPVAAAPRVRVHVPEAAQAPLTPAAADVAPRCPKHPGQAATERCYVCGKPICPKCMELFGYVCSPLCRGKAEAQGIAVPVCAGQKSVVESRRWRKTAWTVGSIAAVALFGLGFWFWYAWIGGTPKPVYSVAFAQPGYSGQTALCGKDQLVFLHGDTLARHDMRQKREVWSRHLVDRKQIDDAIAAITKATQAAIDKANNEDPDHVPKMPSPEKLRKSMEKAAAAELELRVHGQNIWIVSPGKVVRYDWDNGNPVKEIPIRPGLGGLIPCGDELLEMEADSGSQTVTHINLNTCEARTEEFGRKALKIANEGNKPGAVAKAAASGRRSDKAGLPVGMPGADAGKTMDPAKVAEQAQHLSYAATIALPAILANSRNQERTLAEADGQSRRQPSPDDEERPLGQEFTLIPTKEGLVQLSVKLLEEHVVTRAAMKPPPAKSALDGNLTVAKTGELANEMLNQMQRERGGEVVHEDESRYQVTIKRGTDSWSGEVTGRPALYPLKTVNVLTANKLAVVLDKSNKKLWQSELKFNVPARLTSLDEANAHYGLGPCVEHKDTLYLFDEGVLTAFDLATGTVRWRLPSVGIAGLFFDDKDMMYVNTTSASLDSLKYSNQIDITKKDVNVVMKLDSRTGKTLWTAEPGGLINYLSGKFIYTLYTYASDQDDDAGGSPYSVDSIMGRHATMSIRRLNPGNGHLMWEHCQDRYPYDVQFDQTSIRLVFKIEVQVLKFFSF